MSHPVKNKGTSKNGKYCVILKAYIEKNLVLPVV